MAQRRCFGCMQLKNNTICELCGHDERQQNAVHQLPVGTVLKDQYVVGKALGQGGFGITYLGWDRYLEIPVAIKEYYPTGMVLRESSQSLTVTHCEGQNSDLFEYNRKRFLKEAQSLVKLSDIPQVVKVMGFFPENGTAYIIMEFVKGVTLKDHIARRGSLSGSELMGVFGPVMEGLQKVHEAGLVHRDISPDNIMLLPGGNVKLLDFGAVRDKGSANVMQSTQAILKPGFAPLEQYKSKGELGSWTDVYALCATMFYCATGQVPPDSPERMLEGSEPDWNLLRGFTQSQIQTLGRGMALRKEDRIQSAGELKRQLMGKGSFFEELPQTMPVQRTYTPSVEPAPRQTAVQSPSYTVPLRGDSVVSQAVPMTAPVERVPMTAPVERSYTAPVEPTPKTAPVERSYTAPVQPVAKTAPVNREMPKVPPVPQGAVPARQVPPASKTPARQVPPAGKTPAPSRQMPQVPKVPAPPVQKDREEKKGKRFAKLFMAMAVMGFLCCLVYSFMEDRGKNDTPTVPRGNPAEAVMVDGQAVDATTVNYFYVDSVNSMMQTELQSYINAGMLDPTMPLDQQYNPVTTQLWSDVVMDVTLSQMELTYAVARAAREGGFQPPEVAERVQKTMDDLELLAKSYGYDNGEGYLKALYDSGATLDSYRAYLERSYLANAFYTYMRDALQATSNDRSALEAEQGRLYNSYSYNYFYISTASFSDSAQAEQAANSLIGGGIATVEQFDAAIAALNLNDGSVTTQSSTLCAGVVGRDIQQEVIRQWIWEATRHSGEKAVLPQVGEDGSVTGYYAVLLRGVSDNRVMLKNVRHILVPADTPDARKEAENIISQWRQGAANEQYFAQLADSLSADKSAAGGLYTEIYPGQMVAGFDGWCFDPKRYVGEVGIVESEYGVHVMYFSGNSGVIYRDMLMEQDIAANKLNAWLEPLRQGIRVELKDSSWIKTDMILKVN